MLWQVPVVEVEFEASTDHNVSNDTNVNKCEYVIQQRWFLDSKAENN